MKFFIEHTSSPSVNVVKVTDADIHSLEYGIILLSEDRIHLSINALKSARFKGVVLVTEDFTDKSNPLLEIKI